MEKSGFHFWETRNMVPIFLLQRETCSNVFQWLHIFRKSSEIRTINRVWSKLIFSHSCDVRLEMTSFWELTQCRSEFDLLLSDRLTNIWILWASFDPNLVPLWLSLKMSDCYTDIWYCSKSPSFLMNFWPLKQSRSRNFFPIFLSKFRPLQ